MDDSTFSIPEHLQTFVDRTSYVKGFRQLVEAVSTDDRKNIIVLHGPSGMGKTLLIDRLEHEANLIDSPYARIDFAAGDSNRPLRIMRRIRDGLRSGAAHFSPWTERVNQFYAAASDIDVNLHVELPDSGGVHIEDSDNLKIEGNVIGGHHLEIRDNYIAVLQPGLDPTPIEDTLTELFLEHLHSYIQEFVKQNDKRAVLLFDGLDEADIHTIRWFWDSFAAYARNYEGICFVITTREVPELTQPSIKDSTRVAPLRSLKLEDVVAYMKLNGIPQEVVEDVARMNFAFSRGNPAHMVNATEIYIEEKNEPDEDVW